MTLALVSTYCVPDAGDRTGPLPGTHWQSGMWIRPALRKGMMWREARTDRGGGGYSDVEDEYLPSTTAAWDTEVSLRALNAKMKQDKCQW